MDENKRCRGAGEETIGEREGGEYGKRKLEMEGNETGDRRKWGGQRTERDGEEKRGREWIEREREGWT